MFQGCSHPHRFWIVAPVVVGSNPIAHPPLPNKPQQILYNDRASEWPTTVDEMGDKMDCMSTDGKMECMKGIMKQ